MTQAFLCYSLKVMYRYLKTAVPAEIIINKSRFIACLFALADAKEVATIIAQLKKQHPKADHFCYGYIIDENRSQKYSDDGEPQKTAGWPILDVLLKNDIDNCLAVVIRYYGGIKLGAGGLTRAYRNAVAQAVNSSLFIEMITTPLYSISVDYTLNDRLFNLLKNQAVITRQEFKEKVEYEFYCFDDELIGTINNLTAGIVPLIIDYIKIEKNKTSS